MAFNDLEKLTAREVLPGFEGKFIHTDAVTMAYWDVKSGSELPKHYHPHEQISNILEGEFEFTLDGKTQIITSGMVVTIPPNVLHSGKALTDCRILDVFNPPREDYKF